MKLYPLRDYHPERKFAASGIIKGNVMAVNSGVKRAPKKGEWYLSGAIPAAYQAPNDLSTPEVIANLVRIKDVKQVYDLSTPEVIANLVGIDVKQVYELEKV